jgi:hypothetical protein
VCHAKHLFVQCLVRHHMQGTCELQGQRTPPVMANRQLLTCASASIHASVSASALLHTAAPLVSALPLPPPAPAAQLLLAAPAAASLPAKPSAAATAVDSVLLDRPAAAGLSARRALRDCTSVCSAYGRCAHMATIAEANEYNYCTTDQARAGQGTLHDCTQPQCAAHVKFIPCIAASAQALSLQPQLA